MIEEATGDILYTVRIQGNRFQPRVYAPGKYTVKVGREHPDAKTVAHLDATAQTAGEEIEMTI